ncbi:MAG: helix-turn-helix domain-containing protein [Ktedonobacterales bacterium]|nr:helix-turn-helix domain-containing protein [Ktedonobacterales bacterium]
MEAQQAESVKKILLTVNEAARLLSLSRPFLYRLMQRGEIASLKFGSSRRIKLEELLAFVERQSLLQAGK